LATISARIASTAPSRPLGAPAARPDCAARAALTAGPQRGRIGWSGGLGTDFFVDPDGTVGILLTQVEMDEDMWSLVEQFQSLHGPP
jgi:hypothetical protein